MEDKPMIQLTYSEANLAFNALTGRLLALKSRREEWTGRQDLEVIKSFDEDIKDYGALQSKFAKFLVEGSRKNVQP